MGTQKSRFKNTFKQVKTVHHAVETEPTRSQAYGRIQIFMSAGRLLRGVHQSPDLRIGRRAWVSSV